MNTQELTIGQLMRLLWRRRRIVAASTVIALSAGIAAAVFTSDGSDDAAPMFEAAATVRIEQSAALAAASSSVPDLATAVTRSRESHMELIESQPVLLEAVSILRERRGAPTPPDDADLDAEARMLRNSVEAAAVSGTNDQFTVIASAPDPDESRSIVEAVVLAYQRHMRDDYLRATTAAIAALQGGSESSATNRLLVLVDRLADVVLVQVSQVALSGAAELDAAEVPTPSAGPAVGGVISELELKAARLERAASTLTELENGIESGSLSGGSPLQTALQLVQESQAELEEASSGIGNPASGLSTGAEVLGRTSSALRSAASTLSSLRTDSALSNADRAALVRVWRQVNVVAEASRQLEAKARRELDNGGPTEATRTQVATHLRSGAANLTAAMDGIAAIRLSQGDEEVFAQLVSAEGQLRVTSEEMTATAALMLSGASVVGSRVSTATGLLNEAARQLTEVAGAGQSSVSITEIERARITAAISSIDDATDQIRQGRAAAGFGPVASNLAATLPRLTVASTLLNEIATGARNGDAITTDELAAGLRGARLTAQDVGASIRRIAGTMESALAGESSADIAALLNQAPVVLVAHSDSLRARAEYLAKLAATLSASTAVRQLSSASADLTSASDSLSNLSPQIASQVSDPSLLPGVQAAAAAAQLRALSESAGAAAALASEIATAISSAGDGAPVDSSELNARVSLIESELADVASNLDTLDGQVGTGLLAERVRVSGTQVGSLVTRLHQAEGDRAAELETLLEAETDLELAVLRPPGTGDITVAEQSTVGDATPVDLRILAGAAGGLLLGILGALTLEALDRTIRRPEDIRSLPQVTSLGALPLAVGKGNPHPPDVTDDPASLFAEAVQHVTTLLEDRIETRQSTVLITSPSSREGKTTLAINVAKAMALRGRRVLLVDADFKKPDTSKVLDLLDYDGLATALAQGIDPTQFAVRVENLSVLPAGKSEVHPVQLLSRPQMVEFMGCAQERYDTIVIDAPPTIGFAETGPLAKAAGNVVLVARSGVTDQRRLLDAIHLLSEERVLGTVLNFARPSDLKDLDHVAHRPAMNGRAPQRGLWAGLPVHHMRFWRD